MLFREWRQSDTPYLLNLIDTEEEAYHVLPSANYPLKKDNLNNILKIRDSVIVSEINKTVMGLASVYGVNEGTAFLGSVVISKNYRGQNYGQKLINYVINNSTIKFNLKEIHVSCFSDNIFGLLFYSKLGFVPYGLKEKIDKYNKKHILIHLKRILD